MKRSGNSGKTLKMLGGGAIVAGAFAIMFPGLLTYIWGLSRLLILVVVTVVIASVATIALKKLRLAKTAVLKGGTVSASLESAPDTKSDT